MKDNTATIMAAITTLVRRTEEIGASEEIERLTRKLQKENEEKAKLQKEFGQLKEEFRLLREQFETNQMKEHTKKGTPIPNNDMKEFPVLDTHKGKGNTWPEEKTFWMKEQDESRMT